VRIIIGSDHFGFSLKEELRAHLGEMGHEPVDIGVGSAEEPVDYPDVAEALALRIASGEFERGILVCGTGIGMAMVANKIPGVRAACCHDPYSAERARKSNDAHVLTLGSQIVGPSLARVLVDHWLTSEFAGGRSVPKVAKITALDRRYQRAP
jgi:ribose 5-phosphate isomerase B